MVCLLFQIFPLVELFKLFIYCQDFQKDIVRATDGYILLGMRHIEVGVFYFSIVSSFHII